MNAADMVRSFYIGPQKSRLQTGSWGAVQAATAAGLLDETQWVELKEDVPPSTKPANLELARDLASLSVGGGVLVIGVQDENRKATAVVGAVLDGLRDRISQISQATVSPALAVMFDGPYANPQDPARGVLIVVVPPSPGAPHMVDQRYWGRSPNGKRPLPDDEVRLLLESRARSTSSFEHRLRRLESNLDPSPNRLTPNSHLYLLAEPAVLPVPGKLSPDLSSVALAEAVGFPAVHAPALLTSGMRERSHPDGHMLTSGEPYHSGDIDEHMLVRVLLKDEGSVEVVAGAGEMGTPLGSATQIRVLHPGWVVDFVEHWIRLVGHLSGAHLAYSGPWRLGIRIDRMEGVRSIEAATQPFLPLEPFLAREYLAITNVGTDELHNQPRVSVERLIQRLLRGLSIEQRWLPLRPAAQ